MALHRDVGAFAKLDYDVDQFLVISGDDGAEAADTPDLTSGAIDLRTVGDLGVKTSACVAASIVSNTGTPTGVVYTCYLQESADGSTGWTKIDSSEFTVGAADATTGTDQGSSVDLDSTERYIRSAVEIAFTGGSSPTTTGAVVVMLGEGQKRA